VVLQAKVVPGLYACFTLHVVPGGGNNQNSYCGAAQSVEVAVNVIVVPGACGEAGLAEIPAEVHGPTSNVKVPMK